MDTLQKRGPMFSNRTLVTMTVPIILDALLAIAQMPPGIPVATVAINGAMNAGILAVQMLAVGDAVLKQKMVDFKESLKKKIVDANKDLAEVKYSFKTN